MTETPVFAKPGDESRLLEIYHQCFPEDDDAFWRWTFDRLYRPENTLIAVGNGVIQASLQMIPCQLQLNDRSFDAHYIYAASTAPEAQGRGLMRRLLAQAETEGKRRGQSFSVLITQEDSLLDYYARFGYFSRLLLSYGRPQTADDADRAAVRQAAENDIPALSRIYVAATENLLCGKRTDADWRLQLELFGEGAQVYCRGNRITACAFSDERGIIEALGEDAGALASVADPGKPWRTVPGKDACPMGSIKPLNGEAAHILEQTPGYLNLMYN